MSSLPVYPSKADGDSGAAPEFIDKSVTGIFVKAPGVSDVADEGEVVMQSQFGIEADLEVVYAFTFICHIAEVKGEQAVRAKSQEVWDNRDFAAETELEERAIRLKGMIPVHGGDKEGKGAPGQTSADLVIEFIVIRKTEVIVAYVGLEPGEEFAAILNDQIQLCVAGAISRSPPDAGGKALIFKGAQGRDEAALFQVIAALRDVAALPEKGGREGEGEEGFLIFNRRDRWRGDFCTTAGQGRSGKGG